MAAASKIASIAALGGFSPGRGQCVTARRFRRLPDGEARETMPFRIGEGQADAVRRFADEHGVSVGVAVRHCVSVALDCVPWPEYIAVDLDEAPEIPLHVRVTPTMRSSVLRYQQATGARDISAAMRSLVTCGLALPVDGGLRED